MGNGLSRGHKKGTSTVLKRMPKVSVIVPNYNHAPYLERRFNSIFGQTYQDFEVIILDDCSTDNSREVLETYRNHPKVSQFVFNEKNSGSTFKQWNKGVAMAKGEYIWIAESDDEAEFEFLHTLVPKLEENPNVGIAYCQSNRVDETSKIIVHNDTWTDDIDIKKWKEDYVSDGKKECLDALIYKNTIPNASAVIFRRSVFLKAGGGCENMRLCGDWLTWSKMLEVSDIYFSKKTLNKFRFHELNARTYNQGDIECYEFTKVLVSIYKIAPSASLLIKQHIEYTIAQKFSKSLTISSDKKLWIMMFKLSPYIFLLEKKFFWNLWREFLVVKFGLRTIKRQLAEALKY